MSRIYLSPPDVGAEERRMLLDAFDSGWIAPLGPHVDAFERELAAATDTRAAAAVSSGTAGLELALRVVGVGPGDDVLVPTLTFVATANAVTYLGARPVFVDADPATWQVDPSLVVAELDRSAAAGRLPAAVITVDLYGRCADHDVIRAACEHHGVPLVEDAAEALGATAGTRPAGSLGTIGVFSFNGNKILTTSGGGMVVSDDVELVQRVRHLATQAREPVLHYEHREVGHNYRLSNLLAALGRAQLRTLDERIARRRRTGAAYRAALGHVPGISFMPEPLDGTTNGWLTCLTIDPDRFGATRDDVIDRLALEDIESRPVWKPMHLQPVYRSAPAIGGGVAEDLFTRGLCLPSGSTLTDEERDRVIGLVLRTADRKVIA